MGRQRVAVGIRVVLENADEWRIGPIVGQRVDIRIGDGGGEQQPRLEGVGGGLAMNALPVCAAGTLKRLSDPGANPLRSKPAQHEESLSRADSGPGGRPLARGCVVSVGELDLELTRSLELTGTLELTGVSRFQRACRRGESIACVESVCRGRPRNTVRPRRS